MGKTKTARKLEIKVHCDRPIPGGRSILENCRFVKTKTKIEQSTQQLFTWFGIKRFLHPRHGKHPSFLHYQMAKVYILKTSQENSQIQALQCINQCSTQASSQSLILSLNQPKISKQNRENTLRTAKDVFLAKLLF